jgi:tyrosine decarboxylase/aspartate 1-decarboxylase
MQHRLADRRPQSFDRVLSSMCTEPHPAARAAAERFLATNPGDPATYDEVAELESTVVADLARITDLADVVETDDLAGHGYVTSGGTEANLQAVRAARNRSEADDPNIVVPESAHFSFTKAAAVLDVNLRTVPTHPVGDAPDEQAGRVDLSGVEAAVDSETALVVGVAGSTEYGRVDPIPEVAEIATDAGAFCHIDAAWGGFYLPFTDFEWSFGDAAVDSIAVDPHKLGQAAVPAGGLLARETETLDALAVETPYLESHEQATLTGTRSGAGVASAAAAFEALWPDGYRQAFDRATDLAAFLDRELRHRGYDVRPRDLPVVAVDLPEATLESLRDAGWKLSPTASGEARIVLMPHVGQSALESFLADLDRLD